jgi:hypothetical protein
MRDYDFEGFLRDLRAAVAPWGRVGTQPAPKDAPNAAHPDVSADGPRGPLGRPLGAVYQSEFYRGMGLHTPFGMIACDKEGKCKVGKGHAEMHEHLRGQGFHECRAEPGCVKDDAAMKSIRQVLAAGTVKANAQAFLRRVDPRIGAAMNTDNAVLQWFRNRAEHNYGR